MKEGGGHAAGLVAMWLLCEVERWEFLVMMEMMAMVVALLDHCSMNSCTSIVFDEGVVRTAHRQGKKRREGREGKQHSECEYNTSRTAQLSPA